MIVKGGRFLGFEMLALYYGGKSEGGNGGGVEGLIDCVGYWLILLELLASLASDIDIVEQPIFWNTGSEL